MGYVDDYYAIKRAEKLVNFKASALRDGAAVKNSLDAMLSLKAEDANIGSEVDTYIAEIKSIILGALDNY